MRVKFFDEGKTLKVMVEVRLPNGRYVIDHVRKATHEDKQAWYLAYADYLAKEDQAAADAYLAAHEDGRKKRKADRLIERLEAI